MNIEERLINTFNFSKKYYKLEDLQKRLDIHGEEELEELIKTLYKLVDEGFVYYDNKRGYRVFSNDLGLAFGTIEINKNGSGFVHTNDGYTIFIDCINLHGALNGDKVIVENITKSKNFRYYEGKVKQVVKRKTGKALFEVVKVEDKVTLIPYNNSYHVNIVLNKNDLGKVVDGDIIEVIIPNNEEDYTYFASLNKVIGNIADATTDLKALAAEFSIDTTFSDEELAEANSIPTEVTEEDKKGRVDLTGLDFVTIDCDNTKDRDDAVFVKKLSNGTYLLYVSIASVNHYIKRGSALFEGIKKRCTSHYPNNTVIPMLPHKISNGICSLNEKVDRLTKTCEMEIDQNGNVVDYNIYNSVINSRKAMRYSDVNRIINGEDIEDYHNFLPLIETMQELSLILEKAKKEREYLDFDIPEIAVSKENNEILFSLAEQKDAEKMIENFMVMTNTTVASHYSWMPFIYRVHEGPNEEMIKSVIKKMNCSGFKVVMPGKVTRGSLNNLLKKFKTKEECQIFHGMLLKAMAKAKYSTDNYGHYALRLDDYTHFTSPIRRASDFMVHTAIDDLEEHNFDMDYINIIEQELNEVSINASKEEVNDFKFENEARKMAMAEYMEDHIGEDYEGIITDIIPSGALIRTDNLIEGKVSLDDIGDGKTKYRFDYDRYVISSKKAEQVFHVGDKVLVEAIGASKQNRTVDFKLERKKEK